MTVSCTAMSTRPDHDLLHVRIRAEFREMPGLKLTLPQAARLFNVDVVSCERALEVLVEAGALCQRGEAFARTGTGRP